MAPIAPIAPVAADALDPYFLEQWHEFFVMTGTAAVTLAGLLFVSMSFHLDVLLHDRYAYHLIHARQTLLSFIMVLVVSLMALVPDVSGRVLGVTLGLSGLMMLIVSLMMNLSIHRVHQAKYMSDGLRRRSVLQFIGYAGSAALGFAIWRTRSQDIFHMIVAVICLLLATAAGSAWDLMVDVGKLKIREAEEKRTD
jgi:hypothetical protein